MADLTPNNREENWYKGIIDGSTTLTPNNRREYWYQGMIDGSTDLTPNNRREAWYKAIVDSKGGGGGGGDFTTCTMTVSCDGDVAALVHAPWTVTYGDISAVTVMQGVGAGESFDFPIVLWKGNAVVAFEPDGSEPLPIPTLSGAIQSLGDAAWLVSGDCSVAFVAE